MFTFNTADPKAFESESQKINQPYYVLKPGGHFSSAFFSMFNERQTMNHEL
jgi:hypothetical protein